MSDASWNFHHDSTQTHTHEKGGVSLYLWGCLRAKDSVLFLQQHTAWSTKLRRSSMLTRFLTFPLLQETTLFSKLKNQILPNPIYAIEAYISQLDHRYVYVWEMREIWCVFVSMYREMGKRGQELEVETIFEDWNQFLLLFFAASLAFCSCSSCFSSFSFSFFF